jgi:hypothetical protein
MDKLAQSKRQTGRGFFNKVREVANKPTGFLEGIFKPELDRVMTALNDLDDRIRSEITGTKIGRAEEPAIKMSGKDLLKESRKAFNRREYITGVSDLAMFHKKIQNMVNEIDKFFVDVNKIHHKFLFQGVNEDKIKQLREHMEPKAASLIADQLLKEAGLIDDIVNIVSKRGRGLAAYEKTYPKETKDLRDIGLNVLSQADTLLETVIASLKEMATARATRSPDDYMNAGHKIKSAFAKFDKSFKMYYQEAVLPWMKIKDDVEKQIAQQKQQSTNVSNIGKTELGVDMPGPPPTTPGGGSPVAQPVPVPNATPTPVANPNDQAPDTQRTPFVPPTDPKTNPFLTPADSQHDPFAKAEQSKIRIAPIEPPKVRASPVNPPKVRVAHANFYKSLESMSNEDPRILCAYIAKYARSIQGDDPETAIKLFSVVKQLKG